MLAAEPRIDEGTAILCQAYRDTSSSRSFGFGLGPIPWNIMVEWCWFNELDAEATRVTIRVLQRVDAETLRRLRKPPKPAK